MVSFLKKNLLIFFLIFFVGQNAHSLNFKDGEKTMDCDDFISEQAKSMASKNEQINEGNAYYNCREDNSLIDYYFKIGNEKDNYEGAKFDYMGAGIGIVEECLSDDIELLNAWSNLEEIFYLLNYEFGARLSKGKNGTRRWLDCEKNYVMDVKEIKNEITGIANFIKQKYGEKELVNVLDFLDEQIVLKSNNSQNNFEFYTNLFNEIRADQNLTNIKIEEKKEKEDKEPEKLEQKNDSFDVLAELSKNELILLQENLKLLEFYQGSIDGIFGQNTLNALKKWIKSKEYEEIFKEKYLEDISREANLKKDNLVTLSKNAAEKLSISSLSDNDLVFLLKKSSDNFTRDLEGNFIYLGADKIKVCQLQEVSNDDFLKFSTDNFKQQFLKSTNNVKCDRNINDTEVILFQKNNFINLSSNIYFELSENYEILYLSLFEKFQKELDDEEKKKNEIIQKRKETISEIIKGIKDKNLVDYAFIKVESGNICIDQEIEIENSISLKEFLKNNDQYLPDDFQSEILFMALNDVFIGLKTAQCGYVLSNAKNLKLILDGLIRDDLNYQFVPIIIKKTDIKDSNIKEQSDDNKNNQKDVINSSNSISENFIPKENNKTVEPENILKNKKLILKSDLMLVSSNDESCPDIITFSFFNNSTFELYYDTCNPKGNLLTLTGNYETYSDSNNQIKVTTSYAFDDKDYEYYLIFNFQDKI